MCVRVRVCVGVRGICTPRNRTFFQKGTQTQGWSLFDMMYASDTEVWAVGGQLTEATPSKPLVKSAGDHGDASCTTAAIWRMWQPLPLPS